MYRCLAYILCLIAISCSPSDFKHERYIKNNTTTDTIIVYNPDFPDEIDSILPGNLGLIYDFEILDTEQEFEPCRWQGDTLEISNQEGSFLTRSVHEDGNWTYTVDGEKERLQRCTFIINAEDF